MIDLTRDEEETELVVTISGSGDDEEVEVLSDGWTGLGSPLNPPQNLKHNMSCCACEHSPEVLYQKFHHAVSNPMEMKLQDILGLLTCPAPHCAKPLSNRTVYNVLGQSQSMELYRLVNRELRTWNSDKCPDCGHGLYRADQLEHGLKDISGASLRDALAARKASASGAKPLLAKTLLKTLPPNMAYFCTKCPYAVALPSAPSSDSYGWANHEAHDWSRDVAGTSTLCSLVDQMYRLQEGGGPKIAPLKRPKTRKGPAAPRPKTWAKGTGYGGHEGLLGGSATIQVALQKAKVRQGQVDSELLKHLRSFNMALGSWRCGPQDSYPLLVCGAVLGGPLPHIVKSLLLNDSLMDIGLRKEVYMALLELMRLLGGSFDLVPVLFEPLEEAGAEEGGGKQSEAAPSNPDAGPSTSSSPMPHGRSGLTLLDVLQRLHVQCVVFKKSAEELSEGDAEDICSLSLALDLCSLWEEWKGAVETFKNHVATRTYQPPPQQAGPEEPGPSRARVGAKRKSQSPSPSPLRRSKRRAPEGAEKENAEAPQPAPSPSKGPPETSPETTNKYLDTLRPLLLTEQPLLEKGHYFKKEIEAQKHCGGEVMKKRLRRITHEVSTLSTSLPLSWDSSIFLAMDHNHMDVLRACIFPCHDTPYGNGAFLFDIWLPPEYPDKPPKVRFLTTGQGTVRFNPNLYNCGKVCLSLLGTWAGPSWIPGESTLLQVLISLQSMVFVSEPYFNEPGFESIMGSHKGKEMSKNYNRDIRKNTLRWAISEAMRKPDPCMKEVLAHHFSLKKDDILEMAKSWGTGCPLMKVQAQALEAEYDSLLQKLQG